MKSGKIGSCILGYRSYWEFRLSPFLAAGYLCTSFEHIRENVKVLDDLSLKSSSTFTFSKRTEAAMIVKGPIKGDLTKCNNSKGIPLLSVSSMVLGRVVIELVKEGNDAKLRCKPHGSGISVRKRMY